MSTPSQAAERPSGHGLGVWWAILLLGAMTSLYLNIWHALAVPPASAGAAASAQAVQAAATGGGVGSVVLAVTYGLVPVAFAALLSHGLVSPLVGPWPRRAIISLFLIGMGMSLAAQAAVMEPYGGPVGRWGIPIILDASALLALHVITKTAAAAADIDREADLAAVRKGIEAAVRREAETEMNARLSAARADMAAEMTARLTAAQADLHAEAEADLSARLTAARADMAAEMSARLTVAQADMETSIRTELEADMSARLAAVTADMEAHKETDISRRVETETALRVAVAKAEMEVEILRRVEAELARRPKVSKADDDASALRRKGPPAARKPGDDELTSKDRARLLLVATPEMTGAELGRELSLSERSGRRLRDEVLAEMAAHACPAPAVADAAPGTPADGEADLHTDMTAPDRADMQADIEADMTAPDRADIEADIEADMAQVSARAEADIAGGHVRLEAVS